jgi:hypothetical protein
VKRSRFVAVALALVAVAASAMPVVARRPNAVGRGPIYTPLEPGEIENRATLVEFGPISPAPFRVASYDIATLSWADLPYNGGRPPKLAKPPNSDPAGVPYKRWNGKNYYSPGNIAFAGIRFVDGYVTTGNPVYLRRARVLAAKLVEIGIAKGGVLIVPYGFDYPAERLRAPWASAYAQGLAMSLFVRLFRVTGEPGYAETARSLFAAFRVLGPKARHWVAYVVSRDLWLEEYPSSRPSHVFNGANFALFGIYDYERLTRDPGANQMLQAALSSVRRHAADYRVPGGISLYDLVHRTRHESYHEVAIWQLADLGRISGDPYFDELAAAFRADHGG